MNGKKIEKEGKEGKDITGKRKAQNQSILRLMPAMGLEPIRCCHQQILSLPRLPFRHAGIQTLTTEFIIA